MIRADCHQQKQPFADLLKGDSCTDAFQRILQNLHGHLFYRTHPGNCFCIKKFIQHLQKRMMLDAFMIHQIHPIMWITQFKKYFLSTNMTYNRLKMKIIIIIIIIIITTVINTSQVHFFISNSAQAARNPQSWLYFQDFQGSELLNGCLVVWP